MLTKALPVEVQVDAEKRTVEAYASTFGNRDEVGDRIEAGAFAKTVSERGPAARNLIKFFRGHYCMIGAPREMREDSTGLWTLSYVSATAEGNDTLTLLQDKGLTHYSIGYDTMDSHEETVNGETTRVLTALKLYEYGPVDFPANEDAAVLGLKSLGAGVSLSDIPDALAHFGRKGFLTTEEKKFAARLVESWPAIEVSLKAHLSPGDSTRESGPGHTTKGQPDDAAALAGLLLAVRDRRRLLNLTP